MNRRQFRGDHPTRRDRIFVQPRTAHNPRKGSSNRTQRRARLYGVPSRGPGVTRRPATERLSTKAYIQHRARNPDALRRARGLTREED